VLSKSTAALDRVRKLPIYAAQGVSHAWLLDPIARTLEVYERAGGRWTLIETFAGDQAVHAVPFEPIPLELGLLWTDAD